MKPVRSAVTAASDAGSAQARARDGGLSEAERLLLEQIRHQERAPLIIEKPEGLLSARKLTNYALTFLWWSVWGHFMLPLLTLLLWMSGFRRFSEELLGRGGLDALVSRLPLYATVVAVLCGTLVGWALLNWWRFAQHDRRHAHQSVSPKLLAHSYGVAPEELGRWQSARRLVVSHDPNGRPTGVFESAEAQRTPG